LVVPVWQTPYASQQPFGQLVALQPHPPAMHSCPVGQATHATPPEPQSTSVFPGRQVVPAQQPAGHDVALQLLTHW
jgi:hypothetical protein